MAIWDAAPGVITLPDGRLVRGRGVGAATPDDWTPPEFGLYLLDRSPGALAWSSRWVRWRDFGQPHSMTDAIGGLREAHERAASERVEVCCYGGTGRTGTGLAVLAVLSGVAPEDAVTWVREHYRPNAVETPGQRRWILRAAEALGAG
jgi:Protein-tyrosine phosphatase